MAEWCRQHKLQDEYQRHLERILELDPNHADARTALGFRQKDGKWMNRDDVMAARGLVMYEGRYVTPQQVELMRAAEGNRVHRPIGRTASSNSANGSPAAARIKPLRPTPKCWRSTTRRPLTRSSPCFVAKTIPISNGSGSKSLRI